MSAALTALRDGDVKVCLTTGFSPATRDVLLAVLGWKRLVDLALTPADAGHGRPWPDMIHLAARTLGVTDPGAIAVAGDTTSDIEAGRAAGASVVGRAHPVRAPVTGGRGRDAAGTR